MVDWHRLFGLLLTDLFAGSPYVVEVERDLSLKQQILDVVIIRREAGEFTERLPDGLEELAEHNLLTYKSHQQTLNAFAIDELLGHYVNYRKQISPSMDRLLPEEMFNLYAICARTPEKLRKEVELETTTPGVYQARWGTHRVGILVLSEVLGESRNAIWEMFSGVAEKVALGVRDYRYHIPDITTVIGDLLEYYGMEGLNMPYTIADYRRDYVLEHLKDLTPEQRLHGLSPDEVTSRLSLEDRLHGLSPEQIEAYLQRQKRKGRHDRKA